MRWVTSSLRIFTTPIATLTPIDYEDDFVPGLILTRL